jgi:leucine dehydrogenase
MGVTDVIVSDDHEQVFFYRDRFVGLTAIIAIHDTTLGPALGGTRMRAYASTDEALTDVLRLAEGMTYKHALCGNNLGGGKGVIVHDSHFKEGRADLLQSYGRAVETLGGKYITAEDMGTSVADMEVVREVTDHVSGFDSEKGGGGDPSPWTARGVFEGMRACLERHHGSPSYAGRHIAIQGIGHVGYHLAKLLAGEGAQLTITDTNPSRLAEASREFGAQVVDPHQILKVPCDVFAPCAVGGIISRETAPRLQCKIVAGAANNQILGEGTEAILQERGILYAPDFAINAGGAILCASEQEPGGYEHGWVETRVKRIYETIAQILDEATKREELPVNVAIRLARERIDEARKGSDQGAKKKSVS